MFQRFPLALTFALLVHAAALAAPGEVPNLTWCAGSKECLEWDLVSGATEYRVYRGESLSLPCVINPAFDSCEHGTVVTTSTGATVAEVPAAGGLFWFLVTAADFGGEGTYGSATAGPRQSEHTGPCMPTCLPAGAQCLASGDCCSASCIGGSCQTECCIEVGGSCVLPAECCSGACSEGSCQTPCTPSGGSCASSEQCCGSTNAVGSCSQSTCGIACVAGFADCDAAAANGCECNGNLCCAAACVPPHVNGLGQSFDSCLPLGVPGNETTYSLPLAVAARAAWPLAGNDGAAACPGAASSVFRQTTTQCAVWVYAKATAGRVRLNTVNNSCLCPSTGDPAWF